MIERHRHAKSRTRAAPGARHEDDAEPYVVARSIARYQSIICAVPIIMIMPMALTVNCVATLLFHCARANWLITESRIPRQKICREY